MYLQLFRRQRPWSPCMTGLATRGTPSWGTGAVSGSWHSEIQSSRKLECHSETWALWWKAAMSPNQLRSETKLTVKTRAAISSSNNSVLVIEITRRNGTPNYFSPPHLLRSKQKKLCRGRNERVQKRAIILWMSW